MGLVSNPKDNDSVSIRQAIARLGSTKLGPTSSPKFLGVTTTTLTVSGLTTNSLIYPVAGLLTSLGAATDGQLPIGDTGGVPVLATLTGTANEIDVTNAAGSITIGLVNPLIVGKGGSGAATFTDHSILLGSGTEPFTALGLALNGQIPIGFQNSDPVLANITGNANQVIVTNGAGTIALSTPQNIHTGAANFTVAGATIGSVAIPGVYTAMAEPTGFVDKTATLAFDDGTNTFSITGAHDIYINGVKYSLTTDSVAVTEVTTGLYWIYYAADRTLTASTVHPGFHLPFVATVYWNTTTNKGLLGDERHSLLMDAATHEYLHYTVGSRYESGLAGTFDATTLTITTGKWHDEDIEYEPAQQTTCNVLYHNGDANFTWDAGVSVYYKLNGTNLRYNNGNALADCDNNKYMAMWIFATNDVTTPIVALMGQRQDALIANARTNNKYESLTLGTLPYQEMKLLYRVILRNTGSPPTYTEVQDLRNVTNVSSGTYVATAHNVLTGLSIGDDHTQYALLAGRVGGQTLIGSDTTAEDLTLKDNSIDNNTITVTQAISAYTHSGLGSGNPHSVTPTELSLLIGTNTQAWDASLDSIAALTYVSDSFIKVTAEDTYAIRTIAETKSDLSLNLVENTALSTWAGSGNITTVGTLVSGAIGAGFTEIATTYTAAKCTDATADNTAGNETSHADVLVDGDFASAGLMYTNGAGTYSIKAIGTDVQAYHANLAAIVAGTWVGANSITTLGTIATGTWEATDVAILHGGTGQSTAQLAINALTAVGAATNEHVLTKDTGTGNAIWKAAAGGSDAFTVKIDAGATADYIGATSSDGILRTATGLSYTDGGNFVTLGLDVGALTEITTIDAAADFVPVLDATDTIHKKILPTNLGHRFVDRGDPAAWDWLETGSKAVLNTDGTWRDLDCSAIVPVGAVAILFRIVLYDDALASTLTLRKNGNTNAFGATGCRTAAINVYVEGSVTIPCDANRVVEYLGDNLAFTFAIVHIIGWFV